MTRDEMAVAAHEEAENLTYLRGPGDTTLLSTHTVDRVILFLRAVDAALRAPAITGEAERRITTPCPSCGCSSLFVGEGGHLTCSRIGCDEPGVERAVDKLRAAPHITEAQPDLVALVRDLVERLEISVRHRHGQAHNGAIYEGGAYEVCPLCAETRAVLARAAAWSSAPAPSAETLAYGNARHLRFRSGNCVAWCPQCRRDRGQ